MSEDGEKERIFEQLETAIIDALRKDNAADAEIDVAIDRVSGTISATVDGRSVDMATLGHIAARTGKRVLAERISKAERGEP